MDKEREDLLERVNIAREEHLQEGKSLDRIRQLIEAQEWIEKVNAIANKDDRPEIFASVSLKDDPLGQITPDKILTEILSLVCNERSTSIYSAVQQKIESELAVLRLELLGD